MQVLGVLVFCTRPALSVWGSGMASLGMTWLFEKGGEGGPLVDATLEFALARTTKDQSHYCKGPLWNTLLERFNDCFILQIMDQNGLRPGSAISVSVPGVRVAWVTKEVD